MHTNIRTKGMRIAFYAIQRAENVIIKGLCLRYDSVTAYVG